jgi:hypothetical protein
MHEPFTDSFVVLGAPRIGYAAFPARQLLDGEVVEGWLDLKDESGELVGIRGKKVSPCRNLSPAIQMSDWT